MIKRKSIRMIFLCFSMLLLFCMHAGAAVRSDRYTELLLKNAEQYWMRGTCIQYDDPEKYGQSLYFAPEEANSRQTIYTNCGAFVSALYMETFGIELPWRTENLEPYMLKNKNTPYVVDSLNQKEYTSLIKSNKLISHIAGKIKPGDLVVCRFNPTSHKGHVMMVYKVLYNAAGKPVDAWLMHSTGDKTSTENFASSYKSGFREGSVRLSKMSSLIGGFYSKLKNGKSWVYYYGILRPMAVPGKWLTTGGKSVSYTVTNSTLSRFGLAEKSEQIKLESLKKSIASCYVTPVSNQGYTGTNLVPSFTVKTSASGKELVRGKDYIVAYLKDDNVAMGKAFVTIMGIGEYGGSKNVYFNIVPRNVTLSSVSASGKKAIKVKWKKTQQISGYQIQIAENAYFKGNVKTVTVSNKKTTSKTIKNLKAAKTYYVRIRSYGKVGKKKVYGEWSSAKNVKTK